MANIFLFTTIVIVVSSSVNCERRAYLHYSNNFQKALPPHWKHDQEELNRNLVKNQGQPWEEVKLGSHLPSLRPFPLIPRLPPLRPARRPSWPDKSSQNHLYDKEQTQNRVRQLKNKLTPQIYPAHIQTLNQPDRKPDVKVKPQETATRQKREAVINHGIPQGVRPGLNFFIYNPSIYYPGIIDSLSNNTGHHQEEVTEKRDKRQIMLLIKQKNPMELRKMSRTTPNPFIRETNIADYDIVKAGKEKSDTDVVSTFDTDSYLLNEKSSEFSNILSNFYLTTSPEYWPEIQQFADNVLRPLSELLSTGIGKKHQTTKNSNNDRYEMLMEELVTNKRVKRKLDKTLIRKRAKKRKQKQRRVERKRLRMLTHARRLRKQQKSKQARLQRHYARMNLTTTMTPDHSGEHRSKKVNGTVDRDDTAVVVTSKGQSVESETSESEYDSEDEYSDSDSKFESDSYLGGDDGNDDDYEDYDEDSSTNSFEDIDYENVSDKSDKTNKKDTNKHQTNSKVSIKKPNRKNKERNKS